MAHLVRYDGGKLVPSVTWRVGSGKGAANLPDDVMLVSALLKMVYTNPPPQLPGGATRVVVAGPKFTPEMKLFLTHAQSLISGKTPDGIASPLHMNSDSILLSGYIVFRLFRAAASSADCEATVITALAALPHLHHLRSIILGPLPEAGNETVHGGIPGSETAPGSGPTINSQLFRKLSG
jgi:hypothetical protein